MKKLNSRYINLDTARLLVFVFTNHLVAFLNISIISLIIIEWMLLADIVRSKKFVFLNAILPFFFLHLLIFFLPSFGFLCIAISVGVSLFVQYRMNGFPIWLQFGSIRKLDYLFGLGMIIIQFVALLIWSYCSNDLGVGVQSIDFFVKEYGYLFLILLGIPIFSFMNSLGEELLFRGIIQSDFEAYFKKSFVPLVLQSMLFASIHVAVGFPNGKIGYILTMVYSLLLGALKNKTQGLLLPCIVHLFADLLIGYILIFVYYS